MRASIRLGMAVGLCLLLFSCGGHGGSGGGSIARIEVSPQQTSLVRGTTLPLSAVAKTASGSVVDNVGFSWQSLDPSVATIDANGVATGQAIGVATIVASTGSFSGTATLGVVSPANGAANIAISGVAQYQDKPYTIDGFTGQLVPTPIRGAIIKVVAIDGFTTIASGATAQDGTFSFTGLDNSTKHGGIYLQVAAKTEPNNPTQVEIRNNPTSRALLALSSSPFDDSAGSTFAGVQLLATAASGGGGAFNILDVFSAASEMVQATQICPPSVNPPCNPPLLTAYWQPGSSEGTYYDDLADAIFILGGGTTDGDTDEYDDAVIAHEYGHFVLAHFSHDNSPGGTHRITDNKQDLRLSWSEGWGHFFSGAVRNNPVYVDTNAGGVGLSFNLENYDYPQMIKPTLSATAIHDTSEIAVAGMLWDIFDPANEIGDPLALGFLPIWKTIINIPAGAPATMESFWIQFAALNPSDTGGLQTILTGRQVEFFADGSPSPLVLNAPQHHTLYKNGPDPTGDEDIIPFNVTGGTSYTLQTLNLTNAADTLLTITDASDSPISGLQNDNSNNASYQNCGVNPLNGKSDCPPNDQTTLSSSISWTASLSGTLHAHVKSAPNAPPSAGLLGSYDILLTSP